MSSNATAASTAALQQEATDSMIADFARLSPNAPTASIAVRQQEARLRDNMIADYPRFVQGVEREASETRSNMTDLGKIVLIRHLTMEYSRRAMFLMLSTNPGAGPIWVRRELAKKFSGSMDSFYVNSSREPAKVNINVTDGTGFTYYKMQRTNPLRKVFDAWCEHRGKTRIAFTYFWNGARLLPTDTPETVSWHRFCGLLVTRRTMCNSKLF